MAGSSEPDLDKDCRAMFMMCVEKCVGKELPITEKSICKSNAINKLLKECFDPKIANAVDATMYPKLCDKTTKKLTVDQFVNQLLPLLAQHKVVESKKAKNPTTDDPLVKEELEKVKQKIAAKYQEWISADNKPKNAAVVDRLTDVKGYTGAHKERFDAESGKGKGMEGRVEKTDNSGYVGNYKGADTFDKTH
ncbi:tubulin polymerization-promoting protein family member 2-like [Littorina saxatilis]|uniref:Tubulin polymerization-promoting protein family member 3 n=1 Tax=Littorina saxatilis TaxID=31220 RepID=A0AAN9BYL1_9CAEN